MQSFGGCSVGRWVATSDELIPWAVSAAAGARHMGAGPRRCDGGRQAGGSGAIRRAYCGCICVRVCVVDEGDMRL